MLIERLHRLLVEVRDSGGAEFSGVGVLVSDSPENLPIVPLRPSSAWQDSRSTHEALVGISDVATEFHDGFHVLSPALNIILISQYFSPPVVAGIRADPARRLGGRYMAALFGSALPDVLVAGVVSTTYGVAIFQNGREVGGIA